MSGNQKSPATRHGCASCIVPRELVERRRKSRGNPSKQRESESVLLMFGGETGRDEPPLQLFSDVWMFDPDTLECSYLGDAPQEFTPRSYFTATYVEGAVWLLGGKEDGNIVPGETTVWKYTVRDASWERVEIEGDAGLTRRTAHGACLSPWDGQTVIVFGGYALREQRGRWMSDVFEIDTGNGASQRTQRSQRGFPSGSPRIALHKEYADTFARAYMTLDTVGDVCLALFGRHGSKTVKESLVYDKNRELKVIKTSTKVVPRYNHRTSVRSDGTLLACGGDLEGTVALVRYDAMKRMLHMDVKQVGVRKSHCQLLEDARRAGKVTRKGKPVEAADPSTGMVTRLSMIGGYDLGPGEPDVNQVELTDDRLPAVRVVTGAAGIAGTVTKRPQEQQKHIDGSKVSEVKKLLADKERELKERSQALEEARSAVRDQKSTIGILEEDLANKIRDIHRLNRVVKEKDRELDELATACMEERARVDEKIRELEQMEQERDLLTLKFNSELDKIVEEFKIDLRNKDVQIREVERSMAAEMKAAVEAKADEMARLRWDWEQERVARHTQHVKELDERAVKVEELMREKKEALKRNEELEKEFEAARADAAVREKEQREACEEEVAKLNGALARKDREMEDEKARVQGVLNSTGALLHRLADDIAKAAT